jgi:formiminotetrahydrofolate cyclodeaminase
MQEGLPATVAAYVALVAEPHPAPAAGSATALVAALAAALVEKACRLTHDGSLAGEADLAAAQRERAVAAAAEDERAFAELRRVLREGGDRPAAWRAAAAVPLALAERCDAIAALADDVSARCNASLRGDAEAGATLARAAAVASRRLAAIDLEAAGD